MLKKNLSKLLICTIFLAIINALSFQVSLAIPGSITTMFAHDDRQFHGNMFDVTVINPLSITSFDMNMGWGNTTVTVYYRNGTYVGSETNPAAWTVLGGASVTSEGPNNRTAVPVSSPVLQPGTYGFYVAVTPTFNISDSTDMYYTSGARTISNADIEIRTGNGVGGLFGDPAACQDPSRGYPNNPCLFPDRTWNGTIYYDTAVAPTITSAAPGNGVQGVAYSHTYTTIGNEPISFALTDGALPPGLTLSSEGVISGTPTTIGTYMGTVTATNGITPNATQSFSITVATTSIDSDGDGIDDSADQCPGFDDNIDVDGDGTPDGCDTLIDSDNDGVADSADQCPGFDDNIDVDGDGTPDGCDTLIDSDNDGVADSADQCPGFDDNIDVDGDGTPDGCDTLIDSDNDGVADSADQCPGFDDNVDVDGDGTPDGCDTLIDSDNDGVDDSADQCPGFDDNVDVDFDGTPDGCDTLIDSDGDGVADSADQCPGFDDNVDVDNDGTPDGCDTLIDSDNDGVADSADQCPGFDDNIDVDGDGTPDGCDTLIDSDNDGVADSADQCPGFDDAVDTDGDGTPDGCDTLIDSDNDGVADSADQCPGFDDTVDTDGDGTPDGCDGLIDSDGDGVADSADQCPGLDDTVDANTNGTPDCLESGDSDGDGVPDGSDQCPGMDDTIDLNTNGIPDCAESPNGGNKASSIDTDADDDGISNNRDNCPNAYNPGQEDGWGSMMGDACDTDWYNMRGIGISGFEQKSGIYHLHGNCIIMADGAARCPVVASFDPDTFATQAMPVEVTTDTAGGWSVWIFFLYSSGGVDVYQVNVYTTNPPQPDTLIDDRLEIHVSGGSWQWYQRGGDKQYNGN